MTDPIDQIDAYLDGELTQEELVIFRDWVSSDPNHRRMFAKRAAFTHYLLTSLERKRIQSVQNPSRNLTELLKLEEAAVAQLRHISVDHGRHARFKLLLGWGSMAAALVIAISLTFVFSGNNNTARNAGLGPQPERHVEPTSYAKLLGTHLAQWSGPRPGVDGVITAEPMELTNGYAELELTDGARVIVQAPAQFEVIGGNRMVLHTGSLVAKVPLHAHGFTVHTGKISVVDLGTEFGVKVAEDGVVTTAVFDGEVVLRPKDQASPSVPLRAGKAAVADAKGRVAPIQPLQSITGQVDFARTMEDARLMAARYAAEQVIALGPVAYWRFESIKDGVVLDEMGNHHGRLIGEAATVASISGNGLDLGGTEAHVLVPAHPALDSLGKELTLCAWVYVADTRRQAIIHNWDNPTRGYTLEVLADVPGFVVGYDDSVRGRTDHLFAPSRLPTGRWVHLACVCDGKTKAIYVDSELVIKEPARRPDHEISGGIGDLTIGRRQEINEHHLNGMIDEVAVFDKALNADEIRRLYRATGAPSARPE